MICFLHVNSWLFIERNIIVDEEQAGGRELSCQQTHHLHKVVKLSFISRLLQPMRGQQIFILQNILYQTISHDVPIIYHDRARK